MGRAGSGRGGGRASSGGRSAGRVSGGHSVGRSGGGSRAGRGSFGGGSYGGSFSRGIGRGPAMPPPPRRGPAVPPPPVWGGPGMPPPTGRGYRRRYSYHGGGCLATAIVMVFAFVFILIIFQSVAASAGRLSDYGNSYSEKQQTSTIVREKLKTGNAYINDCVVDELGWFDNASKAGGKLKVFWDETGVQPYVILREYDPELTSNAEKEQWAADYYDEHFDTENIFLFVYFAEEDTDNDVGYMAYANGYETSSIMDSEAIEIFWNNIDKYWYTDLSTDEVFLFAFNDTATAIMHTPTTGKDILKWVLIVLVVAIVCVFIVYLIKEKNRRAKEKAAEDERILNTPIHDIADDHLEDKYL